MVYPEVPDKEELDRLPEQDTKAAQEVGALSAFQRGNFGCLRRVWTFCLNRTRRRRRRSARCQRSTRCWARTARAPSTAPGTCAPAAELGAVQTLLITDTLFRINDVAKVGSSCSLRHLACHKSKPFALPCPQTLLSLQYVEALAVWQRCFALRAILIEGLHVYSS